MPAQTDAQRRIAELTTMHALANMLNRASDTRDALDAALRFVVDVLALKSGWIFLRDDNGAFRLAARLGLPPAIDYPGPAWKDGCTCQDWSNENKLHKPGTLVPCSRLRYAVGDKRNLFQHASVPIVNGEHVLGILNIAMTEFGRLTPAQNQILATTGYMIGTALARIRLSEQAQARRAQEQGVLIQLSQDLIDTAAVDSALQRLARVGARLMEADACALIEANEANGQAMVVAAHGWRFIPSTGLPMVLDNRNPHLWYLPEISAELANDALDTLPQLLAAQGFHSHVAKEITIAGAPVALLMVNCRGPRQFSTEDMQLMTILASQATQVFERERLQQEANERQRLEQELGLAREIQASFLPDCCPNVPGYDIAAFYRAARQVGGDFYDFIQLGQNDEDGARVGHGRQQRALSQASTDRFGIVIADVTDKGVPAALFMALSRTVLRATAIDGRPPAAVLELANRLILADSRSGLFVTTFYCILEPKTGDLTFANGGHNYPLVFHAASGEIEHLQALGLVLGIMPDPRFEQQSAKLAAGDVLVLYTDGVTEAMNGRRQLFDEDRLIEVLRASHHLSAEEIIEQIIAAVTRFAAGTPQVDDITLVVVKAR